MVGQRGVQAIEKVVAVEGVVFPGVLAVQGHQHQGAGPVGLLPREAFELAREVAHGIVAVPAGKVKPIRSESSSWRKKS